MTERGEIPVEQRGILNSTMKPGDVAFGTLDIYYNPGPDKSVPNSEDGNGTVRDPEPVEVVTDIRGVPF